MSGLLGGCMLIDQRSFHAPQPGKPDALSLQRGARQRRLLLTVRPDQDGADWPAEVARAVQGELYRKPDTLFVAVAPLPSAASAAVQDEAARRGAADAAKVAEAVRRAGVDAGRVLVRLEDDSGAPGREVKLYAR